MKKTIILCGLAIAAIGLGAGGTAVAYDELSSKGYPVDLVVTNNTPQDFEIPQIAAHLGSTLSQNNVCRFTIQDEGQMKRVLADFEQLLFLTKHENALTFAFASDYDAEDELAKAEALAEAEALAKIEAEKAEAEALAKADAEKAETEALAKAEAEKAEAEALAKAEADKKAAAKKTTK